MREFLRFLLGWPLLPVVLPFGWLRLQGRKSGIALRDGLRVLKPELGTATIVFLVVLASSFIAAVHERSAWLLRNAVLTAMLSAAVSPLIYFARRILHEDEWREHNQRLDAPCRPDNDPHTAFVRIRGESSFDRLNFLLGFHEVPGEAKVLLTLRQTNRRWWNLMPPYSFASIRRQIEEYEKSDIRKKKQIDWVCFVTREDTFVAYQRYARFAADVMNGNAAYADLLNIRKVDEFVKAVRDQKDTADQQKKKSGRVGVGTIPDLQVTILPDGLESTLTRRQAMRILTEKGESDAMLLTKADYKPIGVVSTTELLKSTLAKDEAMQDASLSTRYAEWQKAIPTGPLSPDDQPIVATSHDSPELDAKLPSASPAQARENLLRFTPP